MSLRDKLTWKGVALSIQPRIRLLRSFDQRSHSYLGYALRVKGTVDNDERELTIGIGKGAHAKHSFRAGDELEGLCNPVRNPEIESVEFYEVSKLQVHSRGSENTGKPPPWHGVPPTLEIYRARGRRRLDAQTYEQFCLTCIWGCRMAVEMIIDQWNPNKKRYRHETFCYGPKSCKFYNAGAVRTVPGRKGMRWTEEDWVDEEATAHRGPDE